MVGIREGTDESCQSGVKRGGNRNKQGPRVALLNGMPTTHSLAQQNLIYLLHSSVDPAGFQVVPEGRTDVRLEPGTGSSGRLARRMDITIP